MKAFVKTLEKGQNVGDQHFLATILKEKNKKTFAFRVVKDLGNVWHRVKLWNNDVALKP